MNIADSHSSTSQRSERALLIGVITTSVSLLPTIYAAWISNSVVLLGDLLRCLVEYIAILLSWLIIRRVNRGDVSQFHYGFGKLEQISGLVVAFALFFASATVTFSGVSRMIHPQEVQNAAFGLGLSVLSVIGNLAVWLHYQKLGAASPSPILHSQSRLFRAKTFASGVVCVSLTLSMLNISQTLTIASDPVGSLFLAAFLFRSALDLMSSSMRDLVDCAIDEALQLAVLRILIKHDSLYDGLSQIRTRRSGIKLFIELFLEFSGDLPFKTVSERSMVIKASLLESLPNTDITVISSALSTTKNP